MQLTPEAIEADGSIAIGRGRASAHTVPWHLWIPPIATAMAYPLSVGLFVYSYHAARLPGSPDVVWWVLLAIVALGLACAVPVLALRGLYSIRLGTTPEVIAARRVLHAAAAVPPLYLLSDRLSGVLTPLVGKGASGLTFWWGVWLILAWVLWNALRRGAAAPARAPEDAAVRPGDGVAALSPARLRSIHRMAVVAILAAFLLLHLANHLAALWSVATQRSVMLGLRSWYRAVWMEPVILGLFVIAALSGLFRLVRLTRSSADGFRVLQTASGFYLACFLVSHIWATLGARYHGIDPDWGFATAGNPGLLASGGTMSVLIYYTFALLAVAAHAGLGTRMVLLSRHVPGTRANRAARLTMAFGGALSVLIVAALVGVRLGG